VPLDVEKDYDLFVIFLKREKPDVVINQTTPCYALIIMRACLEADVPYYVDTANWEPKDGSSVSWETGALFRYEEQWSYYADFRHKGLMALLGCGYDPGVTQIIVANALKHHFREIHTLHILDCNAGEHGLPFATNFDPETNIREVEAEALYWENGVWKKVEPIISPWESRPDFHRSFKFLEAGLDGGDVTKEVYLIYHEELQSLVRRIPRLRLATFGMTFGEQYLTHLRALKNAGMTDINPVEVRDIKGNLVKVIPLQVLKNKLPEPASLASKYRGKTHIACYMEGICKDGKPLISYVYNVCDFQEVYQAVGSQAISFTAGVPPAIAAKLMVEGKWNHKGVINPEYLDPDPFMADLERFGLPQKFLFNADAPRFSWL
jgi:saccharopine dehydrogenase (NAD+, L-lysine-forming)